MEDNCNRHWLSKTDSYKMFMNVDNQIHLFPHGRIHNSQDVYQTGCSENVRNLLQYSDGITGTPVDKGNPRAHHLYHSVALRRIFRIHLGNVSRLRFDMDYYGCNVEDCIAHARMHITKMADFMVSRNEEIKFYLKYPSKLDEGEMLNAIRALGCDIMKQSCVAIFDADVAKLKLHSNL